MMLKRKFDEIEDGSLPTSDADESSSSCSSVMTNSSSDVPLQEFTTNKKKKVKKSVKFDGVRVYYFPRIQGFTCVPSEGGSTLGMANKHAFTKDFSLQEFSKEQKRLHQLYIEEQRKQGKVIPEFLERSFSEDRSSDEEEDDSDFEDLDEYYFLQPLSIKQRRVTLRQSGVRKIDSTEKDHCKDIRSSREQCGCECKVFCDPESCACSLAGIKCQVDRLSFPCGCSKDGCGNPVGRIEFNPIRVHTHFIHTLMRIELERREEESVSLNQTKVLVKSDQKSKDTKTACIKESSAVCESEVKNVEIDLTEFNSNELGSCRDCQNSEVCNVMMQEVQYASMEAEQQRAALSLYNSPPQYNKNITNDTNNSATHTLPRVLLFSDNEDDMYHAENTTSFYNFKQEESSYSETSECSSEASGCMTYDGSEYPKTYQTLSSFEAVDEDTNQEFCSQPQQSNYVQTNHVGQKYLPINNPSHLYKLDSISGILNPVHHDATTYTELQAGNWNSKAENYGSQNLQQVISSSSATSSSSSSSSSCSYTTMTNTTCDKIAEACPSISSHINNNSQDYSSELKVTKFEEIGTYSCETNVLTGKTYLNLDGKSSVNQFPNHTEDQGNVSKDINEPTYLSSDVKENQESTSIKFHMNSSSSHSNSSSMDLICSKNTACQPTGQNFGEIIKESIFETVSA